MSSPAEKSTSGGGGMSMNTVTTVMAFSVSAFFVLFIFVRLLCARIHLRAGQSAAAAAAAHGDAFPAFSVERGIRGLEPAVVTSFPTAKFGDGGSRPRAAAALEESQWLAGYLRKELESSTELKDPRFLYGPGESPSSSATTCRLASTAVRHLRFHTLYAPNAAAATSTVTPTASSAALTPAALPPPLAAAASSRLLTLKYPTFLSSAATIICAGTPCHGAPAAAVARAPHLAVRRRRRVLERQEFLVRRLHALPPHLPVQPAHLAARAAAEAVAAADVCGGASRAVRRVGQARAPAAGRHADGVGAAGAWQAARIGDGGVVEHPPGAGAVPVVGAEVAVGLERHAAERPHAMVEGVEGDDVGGWPFLLPSGSTRAYVGPPPSTIAALACSAVCFQYIAAATPPPPDDDAGGSM
uniref:Uncharacterized protein n=2 Tax=Oryza nivara TaxID=4536 RepID=A0A0E0G7M1_ORYNI